MMIFRNLLDFLFPSLCSSCEKRLAEYEKYICLDCLSKIPRTNYHDEENNKLEEFFAGRIPFERVAVFAHFVKGGTLQPIIHELKYKNNPELGVYLGQLCGDSLNGSKFIESIDFIVPIPLHSKRLKERGYNQAYELSRGIAERTHVNLNDTVVIRSVNNPSQAKSDSREARWANVENIFSLTDTKLFEGKHILLIDDVLTTGSTIEACAKELLKITDIRISVYTLAVAT
mgnify:FL=1